MGKVFCHTPLGRAELRRLREPPPPPSAPPPVHAPAPHVDLVQVAHAAAHRVLRRMEREREAKVSGIVRRLDSLFVPLALFLDLVFDEGVAKQRQAPETRSLVCTGLAFRPDAACLVCGEAMPGDEQTVSANLGGLFLARCLAGEPLYLRADICRACCNMPQRVYERTFVRLVFDRENDDPPPPDLLRRVRRFEPTDVDHAIMEHARKALARREWRMRA